MALDEKKRGKGKGGVGRALLLKLLKGGGEVGKIVGVLQATASSKKSNVHFTRGSRKEKRKKGRPLLFFAEGGGEKKGRFLGPPKDQHLIIQKGGGGGGGKKY